MQAIDRELLQRYDRPGPRYTSYPTAPVWSDAFDHDEYATRLRAAGKRRGEPLSLYVHIPYCESMCWYCACSVVISRDGNKAVQYVDDVLAEAALLAEHLGDHGRDVVQHHWGGGTPTFLPPDECRRLFEGLSHLFPLRDGAEVSIEVDPRVTTEAHLQTLADVGFNRISMGVQDFDAEGAGDDSPRAERSNRRARWLRPGCVKLRVRVAQYRSHLRVAAIRRSRSRSRSSIEHRRLDMRPGAGRGAIQLRVRAVDQEAPAESLRRKRRPADGPRHEAQALFH